MISKPYLFLLQRGELKRLGLSQFDNWASNFGETISSLELAPSGQGFRTRDRFAKFVNLPELMSLYRQVADIQTAEMVDLPVPKIKGGKAITISVEPSPDQIAIVEDCVTRFEKVSKGEVNPADDNALCIVGDGRKGALDPRTLNPDAEDYEFSKINVCVRNVFKIYKEHDADKLTQMVFCDISTPKDGKEFSVYDDMKKKLIALGMPSEQVAFIHDAKSDTQKEALFAKMRSGELRVLIGSTSKMGSGTNCQNLMIALHHVDCPYRPSDLEQRNGRIVRQGNTNKEIEIYQYVTKSTFDAYLWQIVETKQQFISQVMTGKNPSRSMEDIDQVTMNFAEVKAIATGNPAIKRKIELEMEMMRLNVLEKFHTSSIYKLEGDILNRYPKTIANLTDKVHHIKQDIELRGVVVQDEPLTIKIGNKIFDDRVEAGALLLKAINSDAYTDKVVGEYKGFQIIPLARNLYTEEREVILKGHSSHHVKIGGSDYGNILRIENEIKWLETLLESTTQKLEETTTQLASAKHQLTIPFAEANTLRAVTAELTEINESFDIGKESENETIIDDEPTETGKKVVPVEDEYEFEETQEIEDADDMER